MPAATLKKFTRSPESIAEVVAAIQQREFDWWLNRTYRRTALSELREAMGVKVPRSLWCDLIRGEDEHGNDMPKCFEWYTTVTRVRPSMTTALDANGWEQLRAAVRRVAGKICGRGIDAAVAVVSTECRCNRRLLEGLNRDLHIWNA